MVEKPNQNYIEVNGKRKGLGYLKALNSIKDFSIENPEVKNMLNKTKVTSAVVKIPEKVDFRNKMTPVRDQGAIGSCTAFSACAMVEYYHLLQQKKFTQLSTLFTYKATRNLMKVTGDTGAYMRSVMGSIALFGVPPEEYWEYDGSEEQKNKKFDMEPTPFCFAFASNYQSVRYLRIDRPNLPGTYTTDLQKRFLANGMPIIIGFTCYDSLYQANEFGRGTIPFPSEQENVIGGHAICLCGYDDTLEITNKWSSKTTKGAFLFKNSWGTEWGDKGYGWIPYEFFNQKLADDCWTVVSQEWVDHVQFQE